MKEINRSLMVYAMLLYILVWYGGSLLAIKYMGMSAVEALGLGTAGGIFLSAFKDSWQFIWRTASPKEKAQDNKINTTPGGTS
ncbi:MAG: hypothetical protein JW967_01555 [Dehalococcoidales bacterium]|nr:hypothetical protein [Dehalococcoidales bacterium]